MVTSTPEARDRDKALPEENRDAPVASKAESTNPAAQRQDPYNGDRAQRQFGRGSLRAETNQMGTEGRKFLVEPHTAAISSSFDVPDALRTAKHPVEDFWVYDGAQPTLGHTGSIPTSVDQILPNKKVTEQEYVEWQRVGAKKGWMFEGRPQESYGFSGENTPTHTDDGFPQRLKANRWRPVIMSDEKQRVAHQDMPKIDIENNARGIGVTGPGSGNGGMAGGYMEINKERLAQLPIPEPRYNWTGSRDFGVARTDMAGSGQGAGGFRAGYDSVYEYQPSMPQRRTFGISTVTQNAA